MNENLPAYIDITPTDPNRPTGLSARQIRWSSDRPPDKKSPKLAWENLEPAFRNQERHLQFLRDFESADGGDPQLDEMELAFRMQTEAPELLDLESESPATKKLYGIGEDHTDEFGRALLLARRFGRAALRYLTINHASTRYGNLWDQHSELESGHRGNANAVDRPIAGCSTI